MDEGGQFPRAEPFDVRPELAHGFGGRGRLDWEVERDVPVATLSQLPLLGAQPARSYDVGGVIHAVQAGRPHGENTCGGRWSVEQAQRVPDLVGAPDLEA